MKHQTVLFATYLAVICADVTAHSAMLSAPVRTATEFQFTVTGESNAIYIIEASTNLQLWHSVLTNTESLIMRTISVPLPDGQRYYRARLGRTFSFALAASELIDIKGNNVFVDSFDSADPNHSDPNGRYDPTKRKDGGDVAAYVGLTNSLNIGSVDIYGVLWTGTGASAQIGANGCVGSATFVDNPANQGTIQPGWLRNDLNLELAAVTPASGIFVTPTLGGVYNGTVYTYVLGRDPLYRITGDLNLNSSALVVTNHVTLWVTRNISFGGSGKIIIAPGARLTLYAGHTNLVPATSTTFGGGGVGNVSANALAFQYYGLPSNTTLSVTGNSAFVGVVYAPNALAAFDGGGSTGDLSGSVIVKNVLINGNFRFHYDEHLARGGPIF
jgi:hypothetical protein